MIIVVLLLFSVIIVSLIFKYYIYKCHYFKEKLLEGMSETPVKNPTVSAANITVLLDQIEQSEKEISKLNDNITELTASLNSNSLTKQQTDAVLLKLYEFVIKLQSEYDNLNKIYALLIENRESEKKKQASALMQGISNQNSINAEIEKQNNAENQTISISQQAKNYANNALNAVNESITAIKNGDINSANNAVTVAQTAYDSIGKLESNINSNVLIAKSDIANKMQTQFNSYKNNAKSYTDITKLSPSIATAVNEINKANVEATNAYAVLTDQISKATNTKSSKSSQYYLNKAKDSYNIIKSAADRSKQNLSTASNIPNVSNLPKIEDFTSIIKNTMNYNTIDGFTQPSDTVNNIHDILSKAADSLQGVN
jgi:uncharacterized protein (UPF0335 family)